MDNLLGGLMIIDSKIFMARNSTLFMEKKNKFNLFNIGYIFITTIKTLETSPIKSSCPEYIVIRL